MRLTAWLAVALLVAGCVGLGTAQQEQAERGVTFKYDGPAGELLPCFRNAVGLATGDVQFTPPEADIAKEAGQRPVSVSLRGARLYDALEELSKALDRRVRLRATGGVTLFEADGQVPLPRLHEGGAAAEKEAGGYTPGVDPRASTANLDIVIEELGPATARPVPRLYDENESLSLLRKEPVPTLGAVRLYPIDLQAAERMVAVRELVLVRPDGHGEIIPRIPVPGGWGGPLGRCLEALPGIPPPKAPQVGEYRLRGAVLVSKVAPQRLRFELPDAVGEPQTLGGVRFTVAKWDPANGGLTVVREGGPPERVDPNAKPRGAIWMEVKALDARGQVLPSAAWEAYGGPKMTMEMTYLTGLPRVVQVRTLIITSDDEVAVEPFEISFRLPQGLAPK